MLISWNICLDIISTTQLNSTISLWVCFSLPILAYHKSKLSCSSACLFKRLLSKETNHLHSQHRQNRSPPQYFWSGDRIHGDWSRQSKGGSPGPRRNCYHQKYTRQIMSEFETVENTFELINRFEVGDH